VCGGFWSIENLEPTAGLSVHASDSWQQSASYPR
jgi:hypothetical protein